MQMRTTAVLTGLLVILLAGCSARAGGVAAATRSFDLGLATQLDVQDKPVRVLRLNAYEAERVVGPPNVLVQTRWVARTPFADEQAHGITDARTRFIMEARPRQRNPEGGVTLYTARLRVENMGRTGESDWVPLEPTPQFQAYAERIAAAVREELEAGIRISR
jgi:hypothetical protein